MHSKQKLKKKIIFCTLSFNSPSRVRPCTGSDPASKNRYFKQHGQSSFVIVIFVLVIIFAVMLSGGSASLFSGNLASPVTPTPTGTSVSPSPTASPSANWSISENFLGCNVAGFPQADIISQGSADGYILLEVKNSKGKYTQIGTANFVSPKSKNTVVLLNTNGFNSQPWRVSLYSGGNQNSSIWSGGTLQKTYDANATNC